MAIYCLIDVIKWSFFVPLVCRIFNTNNLWIKLAAIERVIQEQTLHMEIIVNPKVSWLLTVWEMTFSKSVFFLSLCPGCIVGACVLSHCARIISTSPFGKVKNYKHVSWLFLIEKLTESGRILFYPPFFFSCRQPGIWNSEILYIYFRSYSFKMILVPVFWKGHPYKFVFIKTHVCCVLRQICMDVLLKYWYLTSCRMKYNAKEANLTLQSVTL